MAMFWYQLCVNSRRAIMVIMKLKAIREKIPYIGRICMPIGFVKKLREKEDKNNKNKKKYEVITQLVKTSFIFVEIDKDYIDEFVRLLIKLRIPGVNGIMIEKSEYCVFSDKEVTKYCNHYF